MSNQQRNEVDEITDELIVPRQPDADASGLTDRDLDGVAGGVRRRGPGTQTEDDVYVG